MSAVALGWREAKPKKPSARGLLIRLLFVVFLLSPAGSPAAADPVEAKAALLSARVALDLHTRAALERALALALRKLSDPGCHRLFVDLPPSSGAITAAVAARCHASPKG